MTYILMSDSSQVHEASHPSHQRSSSGSPPGRDCCPCCRCPMVRPPSPLSSSIFADVDWFQAHAHERDCRHLQRWKDCDSQSQRQDARRSAAVSRNCQLLNVPRRASRIRPCPPQRRCIARSAQPRSHRPHHHPRSRTADHPGPLQVSHPPLCSRRPGTDEWSFTALNGLTSVRTPTSPPRASPSRPGPLRPTLDSPCSLSGRTSPRFHGLVLVSPSLFYYPRLAPPAPFSFPWTIKYICMKKLPCRPSSCVVRREPEELSTT